MPAQPTGQRRKQSLRDPERRKDTARPEKLPVHGQPVSPCDDLQARIAKRAYEIHAERGYRYGYALDDWLEAEREVLSSVVPS